MEAVTEPLESLPVDAAIPAAAPVVRRPARWVEGLAEAARQLAAAGVASPEYDAQELAASVIGCSRAELFFHRLDEPEEQHWLRFCQLVHRRAGREPLQHILGEAPFGPLSLKVTADTFIPRPETEQLADWAVARLRELEPEAGEAEEPLRVVDLGTGSGAIAAYLAHSVPGVHVTALEINPATAEVARENIEAARAAGSAAEVVLGDMHDPEALRELHGKVQLVVSNPPYVPSGAEVDEETTRDPAIAVFSGETGLDTLAAMRPLVAALLAPGGWFGVEHDDSHQPQVVDLLEELGIFESVTPAVDLAGRARFVFARRRK